MRFINMLAPASQAGYLLWKLLPFSGDVTLRLKTGDRLPLRRPGKTNDYGAAYDVLLRRCYEPPEPIPANAICQILDLGGNVGYSVLFFARQYPAARISVFEPHPVSFQRLKTLVRFNPGLESRVQLHQAAAGTEAGKLRLSDHGTSSSITKHREDSGLIEVPAVDIFRVIENQRPDLLKMDIEGGEYAIMTDPRFDRIATRYIVMEWHTLPDYPHPEQWCSERLNRLGYRVIRTQHSDANGAGVLWAYR